MVLLKGCVLGFLGRFLCWEILASIIFVSSVYWFTSQQIIKMCMTDGLMFITSTVSCWRLHLELELIAISQCTQKYACCIIKSHYTIKFWHTISCYIKGGCADTNQGPDLLSSLSLWPLSSLSHTPISLSHLLPTLLLLSLPTATPLSSLLIKTVCVCVCVCVRSCVSVRAYVCTSGFSIN